MARHAKTPHTHTRPNPCLARPGESNRPTPPRLCSPLEGGWRKDRDGPLLLPGVRLRQEVVSINGQPRRGQRITVPVQKLFAREKRPYGLGMVGKLTNRTYRKRIDSFVQQQIEDMDDHR